MTKTTTESPRCEQCDTRIPENGSLVYDAGRWRCDGCRATRAARRRWDSFYANPANGYC